MADVIFVPSYDDRDRERGLVFLPEVEASFPPQLPSRLSDARGMPTRYGPHAPPSLPTVVLRKCRLICNYLLPNLEITEYKMV